MRSSRNDGKYPWYEIVDGAEPLLQGDFVASCPVLVPRAEISPESHVRADAIEYNVVVMTQSCDLEQEKVTLVLVCPYQAFGEVQEKSNLLKGSEGKKALKRGNILGFHLLNKCDLQGFATDFLVVDFRSVYGVDFGFLKRLARERGRRLRLLPPYREHLSQAFARFFMRVGLPVEIPFE
jgi:hypothetical protein